MSRCVHGAVSPEPPPGGKQALDRFQALHRFLCTDAQETVQFIVAARPHSPPFPLPMLIFFNSFAEMQADLR